MPSTAYQDIPSINDGLRKLKSKFVEQMFQKILAIEAASTQLSLNPNDTTILARIQTECHKLAGVSKTLGFDEIGTLAQTIDGAIEKKEAPWATLRPTVEQLLDAMEAELDRAPL